MKGSISVWEEERSWRKKARMFIVGGKNNSKARCLTGYNADSKPEIKKKS